MSRSTSARPRRWHPPDDLVTLASDRKRRLVGLTLSDGRCPWWSIHSLRRTVHSLRPACRRPGHVDWRLGPVRPARLSVTSLVRRGVAGVVAVVAGSVPLVGGQVAVDPAAWSRCSSSVGSLPRPSTSPGSPWTERVSPFWLMTATTLRKLMLWCGWTESASQLVTPFRPFRTLQTWTPRAQSSYVGTAGGRRRQDLEPRWACRESNAGSGVLTLPAFDGCDVVGRVRQRHGLPADRGVGQHGVVDDVVHVEIDVGELHLQGRERAIGLRRWWRFAWCRRSGSRGGALTSVGRKSVCRHEMHEVGRRR